MFQVWFYSLASVFIISLISFIGILTFSIKADKLKSFLIYFLSFSAGALFGDAFIHLIPEIVAEAGFGLNISIYIILGIVFSFTIEKVIHWNHCHLPITKTHVHPFSIMNLVGDGVHNLIDGIIIGASYLMSIPLGIYTSIAIVLHEIPQEIGDFGVLLHGGFTKSKALILNFLIALISIVGVVIALVLGSYIDGITIFLVPFAAGSFIYIAGSDLIPELHKECETSRSLMQLLMFIFGVLVMVGLVFLG